MLNPTPINFTHENNLEIVKVKKDELGNLEFSLLLNFPKFCASQEFIDDVVELFGNPKYTDLFRHTITLHDGGIQIHKNLKC